MVQPAGAGAPTLADASLAGEHEQLRALIEDISDVIIVLDQAAVIRYASASIERITGVRPDEVVGLPVFDLLNPEHRTTQEDLFESVLRDGSPRAAVPLVVVDRGGVRHQLEVILTNRVDHPAIGGVVVTARDISERAEADRLLAQESVLLEAIARGLPMESVLQQVSRLIERHVDRASCSVGVLEHDGIVRHHSAVSLPPEIVVFLDNTDPLSELGQSLRMLDSDVVIYDDIATDPRWEGARSLASDHDLAACWTLTVNASDTGDLLGVLTVFHPDRRGPFPAELALLERCRALAAIAIERRRVEARLQHQALHDSLTGLPNRTLIFDRIEQALARSRRRGTDMAVLFVDLDQFKVINDSLGHAAGDRLLEQVAARFSAMVRSDDTVGRFGGDEFVVVCEDVEGEDGAMDVGNRLRRSLAPPFPLGAAEVVATASVGIVMATDTSTPEALIRDSDAAMYRAKAQGRNRCAVADQAMHLRLMHRLELEHALRGAIDGDQLILHYQPRVRLADGVVTGMEALLRWRHADGRLLGADETVPLAEETGLIVPIGAWALGEACRQAVRWDSVIGGPPLGIHVNVSARQLADPNLVDLVTQTLATTGLDAERLCLEVTESVLASDADGTSATLAQLKELGLRLAIDDFGTGYATLDYLRRFSMADELKIDRSFVAGLTHFHSTDAAIVSAAVVLADALGFEAVAEGVETVGQLAVLRRLGCTQAQGYLFCPPLPAAEVEAHLRR